MVCYTDGSKKDGFTGAGFFCEFPLLEASIFTGTYATVYQTELFAISELCTTEALRNASGKDIYICTDSQSAIEAISSPIVDSWAVRECKVALNAIGSGNKVTILWVPGHEGIPGNEKADLLAGNGTGKSFIGPEPRFGISKTTRKRLINQWLTEQHRKAWREYVGAKHTKIFCKAPSKDFSQKILNLNRPNIKRTVEIITNHCGLNKYLYDIGFKDNPKCDCGYDDETGAHIIFDCIRYRRLRATFLGKPDLTPAELELDKLDLEKFAKFLERTKRLE
jgi:ribonuclease HI